MKSLRTGLPVSCTLALCPMTLLAQGFYYEAVTNSEVPAFGNTTSTVHAWVDGDRAKIEFQDSGQAGFGAGSYLLTTDGGAVLYIVNPQEQTYSEIDFENLFSTMNTAMEAMGGMMQMEFTDFTNEQVLEEPGETILGYPTTHYQFRTGYTMNMSIMGMNRQSRNENDSEFWCSDELSASGLRVWLRPDKFRTGNEEFDQLIEQGMGNMNCLPLRSRTVSTMTNNNQTTETTSTTEVTVFREETVAADMFEIPTGYAEEAFIPDISGMPQGEAPEGESMNPFGMGFGMGIGMGLGDLFQR